MQIGNILCRGDDAWKEKTKAIHDLLELVDDYTRFQSSNAQKVADGTSDESTKENANGNIMKVQTSGRISKMDTMFTTETIQALIVPFRTIVSCIASMDISEYLH